MRVPIRKPGKYTHQKSDLHITASKLQTFKDELDKLKSIIRPRDILEVKRLSELGDFSENAEYQLAKARLRGINARILELEEAIKNAIIITSGGHSDRIQIGHRVTLEMAGQEHIYQILGSAESNPHQGIISHTSPIGSALIGKKVGDKFIIKIAEKEVGCKILIIE